MALFRWDDDVDGYDDVIVNNTATTSGRGRAVRRLSASHRRPVPVARYGQFVAREMPAMQCVLWAAATVLLRQRQKTSLSPRLWQVRDIASTVYLTDYWLSHILWPLPIPELQFWLPSGPRNVDPLPGTRTPAIIWVWPSSGWIPIFCITCSLKFHNLGSWVHSQIYEDNFWTWI